MRTLLTWSSAAYLLVLMLIKTMGMPIAVLDYSMHKDFIAATLCENKDRPETHCSGKCFLKKQLAHSDESPGSQEEKGASKNFSVDFCESIQATGFTPQAGAVSHNYSFTLSRRCKPFIAGVFHPPLRFGA